MSDIKIEARALMIADTVNLEPIRAEAARYNVKPIKSPSH